ncbi:MAG TPA: hypothetical protein VHL53_02560, partial [Acidimicrobiia bacterium]|nr:hypothetical protein [Acidimicrobiia bacterium]
GGQSPADLAGEFALGLRHRRRLADLQAFVGDADGVDLEPSAAAAAGNPPSNGSARCWARSSPPAVRRCTTPCG